MIHYHGTPLSPRSELFKLAGKNFCVPFSDPRDADTCLSIGQAVMFDNGAFSAHTKGKSLEAKRNQHLPWIHMLRGMNLAGDKWPFASVDSTNVARNFKDTNTCPERMARRIDSVQCPVKWTTAPQQVELFQSETV